MYCLAFDILSLFISRGRIMSEFNNRKTAASASERRHFLFILAIMALCAVTVVGSVIGCQFLTQGTAPYLILSLVGGVAVAAFMMGVLILGLVFPSKIKACIQQRREGKQDA